MGEEKKTGLADAVETGASAAHTIKGAIKAGKAIPGAAKGAAAGGPYGAVAGAVWAGRKHIGKIIAVIIILLLLPVLFVLMLPGLIFGGLVTGIVLSALPKFTIKHFPPGGCVIMTIWRKSSCWICCPPL